MKKQPEQMIMELSPREKQILGMIADGVSREKISQNLKISKLTYDGHRKNIRQKLGIHSQADWMKVLYHVSQDA